MMLTEAEHAHFNDLKFMYEVDLRHSSYDISNDIVSYSHDHKDLKKILSEFTHVINAENFVLLLTDHYSDSVIETYQDFQKAFSEFTDITHTNSSTVSFCHHDSDSVTESSSLLMHDNHADTSVIALASHSHHQYKSVKFIHLTDNFNDMMKLDKFSLIIAISDHSFCNFNAKKQQLNADSHTSSKTCHHNQLST